MEKRGLEYIDDFENDDDPLYKVEKVNINKEKENLNKEKENFLALLNKPTEEVNAEEDNKDVMIDNDGEFKTEHIGRFKELWDEDDDKIENNENENGKNKENSSNIKENDKQ